MFASGSDFPFRVCATTARSGFLPPKELFLIRRHRPLLFSFEIGLEPAVSLPGTTNDASRLLLIADYADPLFSGTVNNNVQFKKFSFPVFTLFF